tara:strand:+ start:695 stop:1075 length:381 start_codon:yes stop_codon:yes gene_type:complete
MEITKKFLIASNNNEILGAIDLPDGYNNINIDSEELEEMRVQFIEEFFNDLFNDRTHGSLTKFNFLFPLLQRTALSIGIWDRDISVNFHTSDAFATVEIYGSDGMMTFHIIEIESLRNLTKISNSI